MIDVRPKLGTPHWREDEARHRKYFVVLFEDNYRLSRSWFADINIKKITTSTSLLDSSVKDQRGPAAADRRVRQLLGKSAEERLALLSWDSHQAAATRKASAVGSVSENDPTVSGKRTGSLPASVVTKMAATASPPFIQSTANENGVTMTAGDSQGRPSLTAGRPDGSGRKISGWAQLRSIYPEATVVVTQQKSSATKEISKENAVVPRKERWTVTAESSQRLSCRRSSVTSLSTSSDTVDVSSRRRGVKNCCNCIAR
jgi:hypothetical protein